MKHDTIAISTIRVLDFWFNQEFENTERNRKEELVFETKPEVKLRSENHEVAILLSISAFFKESSERAYKVKFAMVYTIANYDDLLSENTGDVSKELAAERSLLIITLLGMTFSTLRGILCEKFSSTIYRDKLLPVVDPTAMYNHMIEDAKKESGDQKGK